MAKKQTLDSALKFDENEIEEQLDDTVSEKVRFEYVQYFKNLESDITHIDNRMSHIQKFITNLDTQVQHIQSLIKSDANPGKRGNYYQIMNTCMELNARYEDLYIKCMDLKQKYRKEQDDLKHKVSRLVDIDIPKSKVDVGHHSLTPGNLAMMIQELTSAIGKNDRSAEKIQDSIQTLYDDPDYQL